MLSELCSFFLQRFSIPKTSPVFSECHVAAWRPIKASAGEEPCEPPTGSFVEVSPFASKMSCQSFRRRPAGGSICVLVLIKSKQVIVCEVSARLRPPLWVRGALQSIIWPHVLDTHTHATLRRHSCRATAVMLYSSRVIDDNLIQTQKIVKWEFCNLRPIQASRKAGKTDK